MKFHLPGLPNYPVGNGNTSCAYSEKIRKFILMMTARGHECIFYGLEDSKVPCEHIITMTLEEQKDFWGDHDYRKTYSPIVWDASLPYWQLTNQRASYWIKKKKKPKDFLGILGGNCQRPILENNPDMMCVEYGVGYYGIFAPFRCFESYSHMHHVYGHQNIDDGKFYDCVIPNYFDTKEFPFNPKPKDYALYIGRVIQRKGVEIAVEATRRVGMKLLIAGQGVKEVKGNKIIAEDGMIYEGDHIEFVGWCDGKRRAELMSNALCGIVPTIYVEPFGGVACEFNLTGTPCLTSSYGAFTETVEHGVTGYRCHTIPEFCYALRHVHELDRKYIHDRAIKKWSLEAVAPIYETYFERLLGLYDKGFYNLQEPTKLWET